MAGLDFDNGYTKVEGAEKLVAYLTVLPGNAKEAALQALLQISEDGVLEDSKENYVPFRLGDLKDSGTAWRDGDVVKIEYGVPPHRSQNYAVEQHEVLTYNHPGGGGPKYLEIPLNMWLERIFTYVAQAVGISLEASNEYASKTTVISKLPEISVPENAARKIFNSAPRLIKKA
jgi:hypothetical protein